MGGSHSRPEIRSADDPEALGSGLVPESSSRCSISGEDGRVVVTGEIDAHTAPALAAALEPHLAAGDVDLDLRAVDFMDSSGLRVLIDAHQRCVATGSRLVLHEPSRSVRRIIEVSGLAEHLNLM